MRVSRFFGQAVVENDPPHVVRLATAPIASIAWSMLEVRAWMLAYCKSYVHKMALRFDCLFLDWITPRWRALASRFFKVGIPRHARFR
jgi:hypothetical protein